MDSKKLNAKGENRHVEGSKRGSVGKGRGEDWEHRRNVGAPWEGDKSKHGNAQRTPRSLRLAGVPEPAAGTALALLSTARAAPIVPIIQAGALVALS